MTDGKDREIKKLKKTIEELRGGGNRGPYERCPECNRRMVWQKESTENITSTNFWMCPNCVFELLHKDKESA